jgi:hypothetical protein
MDYLIPGKWNKAAYSAALFKVAQKKILIF